MRQYFRSLAVSLNNLGDILRERGDPTCIETYEESFQLSKQIGDKFGSAMTAISIGHVYLRKYLPTLLDLDEAEQWYRRGLALFPTEDRLGRGRCLAQLGAVTYERFKMAREDGASAKALKEYLSQAAEYYHHSLELSPPDAPGELAVDHNQLGNIYSEAGDLERCFFHWRESIRYEEAQGNVYGAAQTRGNIALAFARAGRWLDALDYARAALRDFQSFGAHATQDIQETQRLIALIEQGMREDAALEFLVGALGFMDADGDVVARRVNDLLDDLGLEKEDS
jgi:tetratricopeptide (TPR) repeat protein